MIKGDFPAPLKVSPQARSFSLPLPLMLHDAELQEQLNIREQCKELLCLQQKANGMQPMPPSVAAGGITSIHVPRVSSAAVPGRQNSFRRK